MEKYQKLYKKIKSIEHVLKSDKIDNLSRIELFESDIEQSEVIIKGLEEKITELDNIKNLLLNYGAIKKANLKKWIKVAIVFSVIVFVIIYSLSFKYGGPTTLHSVLVSVLTYITGTGSLVIIAHKIDMQEIREIYTSNISKFTEIPNMKKELEEQITDVKELSEKSNNTIRSLREDNKQIDVNLNQIKVYLDYLLKKTESISNCVSVDTSLDETYDNDQTIEDIVRLIREKNYRSK